MKSTSGNIRLRSGSNRGSVPMYQYVIVILRRRPSATGTRCRTSIMMLPPYRRDIPSVNAGTMFPPPSHRNGSTNRDRSSGGDITVK